jgi:hypothetical protein
MPDEPEPHVPRRYTVQEIDALRNVVENKYLNGTYRFPLGYSVATYNEQDKEHAVEQRVRTHMLAGHTARDLLDSEPERVPPSPEELAERRRRYEVRMKDAAEEPYRIIDKMQVNAEAEAAFKRRTLWPFKAPRR